MSDRAERLENTRLIQQSAAFVCSEKHLRKVKAARYQLPGLDHEAWREFAELGWLSLRLPEARGGTGFGAIEFCALAEQLGSGLVAAPIISAIATAPLAPDHWLERIGNGEAVVLPAWQEKRGIECNSLQTRFIGRRLTGEKRYIPMGAAGDAFVVTTADGLVFVERNAPGISFSADLLQDGGHYGTLCFLDTPASAIPGEFAGVGEEITLATAAYLLGVMRKAFEITNAYLSTRVQFGKPIGSFQSVQHRMVDLHIQIELTRASVRKAAIALDDEVDYGLRLLAVSRAKARASTAAMLVTRQAIQLHGGIGYSDECDIGLHLRKAMVLANFHGSAQQHRTRFAQLSAQQARL